MSFYRSNAVYEQLESEGHTQFAWLTGNAWALVYGDSSGSAKLAVLATGTSSVLPDRVRGAFDSLFGKLVIPAIELQFDDSVEAIDAVRLSDTIGQPLREASLNDLAEQFRRCGLPIAPGHAGKAVNAHTSSAFHNWQRQSLGSDIAVSDFDLLRLDEAGATIEAIELKRSYIALDQWAPFPQDYVNFVLLCSALQPLGIPLTIAYNRRTKNPFFDDPASLSLFDFQPPRAVRPLGVVTFAEFVAGAHLA